MDISIPRTRHERDRIREGLVRAVPGLGRRLVTTPSGSLLLPLPHGDGVEIGRLPRNGRSAWAVVSRLDGRTVVRTCTSADQMVRLALRGLRTASAA